MAQTLYIQLSNLGGNTGPFDLYSVDINGIETLVQSNVSKSQLLSGLLLTNIPDNAVKIKVQSVSALCSSYNYINIPYPTTTTSTVSPTTTSTTSNVVVSTCSPIYYAKGAVYSYNTSTNFVTSLFVPGITGSTFIDLDIAHTATKMWFVDFRAGAFVEYNITLSPWSATFNQNLLWPPGFVSSAGLHAINNTTLLVVNGSTTTSVVGEFNTLTGVFTSKFNLPAGRGVTGDFLLTTTNKFIVLSDDGTDNYISQYDYTTGTLEFEKKLNPTINFPYGLFESGSLVYIMDGSSGIYTIGTSSPNTITRIGYPTNGNPLDIILGASQIASCLTQEFSNNLTTTTTLKAVPTTTTTTIAPSTTTTTTISACNCYTIKNLETDPSSFYRLDYKDCDGNDVVLNSILPGASFSWCGNGIFNPVKNPSNPTPSTWIYSLVNNGPCGASCPPVPPTTTTSTVTPTTTASPTTSTTTIAPSTTTTTTIACNCITIVNTSGFPQDVWYTDCDNNILLMPFPNSVLPPYQSVQVCGSNATARQPSLVNIAVGANCVSKKCPATSTTTTVPPSNICTEVVFTNNGKTGTVVYADCNKQNFKLDLAPLQVSFNTCLILSSIVTSSSDITYSVVGSCLLTTTTSTTTAAPSTTTTTTVNPYILCAISPNLWSTTNLSVTTYRNGDAIPQVTDPTAWAALTTGAWCYYNNDPATEPIYGRLYNWEAVDDFRGLAPLGYRVATSGDWSTLSTCVGSLSTRLKSTTGWAAGTYSNGNNLTGFTALPGGQRSSSGTFSGLTGNGYWWFGNTVGYVFMGTNFSGLGITTAPSAKFGLSVRIIQN